MISALKNKTVSALRWSQKYTKVDMVYLAKGGGWLGIQQVLITLAAFVLSIMLANFVDQADFGKYRFALSVMALLLLTSLPGMSMAVIRAVANKQINSIWGVFFEKVRWGFVGLVAGLCYSLYTFLAGDTELALIILLISLCVPFFDTALLYESWLRGKEDFKKVSIFKILTQVMVTVALSLAVFFFDLGALWIVALYVVVYSAARGFFFTKVFSLKKETKNSPDEEKEVIVYGRHITLMNIFTTISVTLDKIIVFYFLGPINLAIYSFALALPDQIKAGLKQVISVSVPRLAKQTFEEIQKVFIQRLVLVMSFATVLVFAYIIVAPFVYSLFFPSYIESAVYSQILSIILIPNAGMFLIRMILYAQKKIKTHYVFSVIYPSIQIVLFSAGFVLFGLIGLVWGIVVAQWIGLLFGSVLVLKSKNNLTEQKE